MPTRLQSRMRRLPVVALAFLLAHGVPVRAKVSPGAGRPTAWSDARLKQVVIGFGDGSLEASAFPASELPVLLPRIARLQSATPRNESFYYFAAFTLAYFGHEYRRNVARLIYPVQLWEDRKWKEFFTHEYDPLSAAPTCLHELYLRNHDPALLKLLFSWGLDGNWAEGLDAVRDEILRSDSLPVLNLALRSPLVTSELTEFLAIHEDPGEYRSLTGRIRSALRRAPPATRQHARRLLRRADALNRLYGKERDLRGADLEGAALAGWDFLAPDLRGANLRGADLSGMRLNGWNLRRADLGGANLRGTDLRPARLTGAKLRGARYDAKTRWPRGFDPRRHGAVLAR